MQEVAARIESALRDYEQANTVTILGPGGVSFSGGHLTIDACVSCQFEQQVRAICGLPLGAPDLLRPAAMANLLGELWDNGDPRWARALDHRDVKLHLYGKAEARAGRKMGHLTALAPTTDEAVARVVAARTALTD